MRARISMFKGKNVWAKLCLCVVLHFLASGLRAETPREFQVKAVFLFRLTQFVSWPTNAFENAESPMVIGVLGVDPFGEALDLAVRDERSQNRPVIVRRFKSIDEVKNTHVLFICHSEEGRLLEIMTALKGKSVLTVSDIEDFVVKRNGMVQFLTQKNKVNLRIAPEVAKSEGLSIDSRLLRTAEVHQGR